MPLRDGRAGHCNGQRSGCQSGAAAGHAYGRAHTRNILRPCSTSLPPRSIAPPPFVVTSRETVLSGNYFNGSTDLNPDGDRLIVTLGAETPSAASGDAAEPERFLLVVNWFEELKERIGN